jgi:hypothetical protein
MNWIDLAQEGGRWRDLVILVMNEKEKKNVGNTEFE